MSKLKRKCEICGKEFTCFPSIVKIGRGKYCSNPCRHKARSNQLSGEGSNFWAGGKVERDCLHCSTKFYASKSRTAAKFCSFDCANKGKVGSLSGDKNGSWNGGPVSLTCKVCLKEFSASKSLSKNGAKFCSRKCKSESQVKEKIVQKCDTCGCSFDRYPSDVERCEDRGYKGRYCGRKCSGDALTERQAGEGNPQWRGGVTPENKRVRDSKETMAWRTSVFQRDHYACQHCGARNQKGLGKSVYIHAHHIKGFASHPKLRFDLDNGLTLCAPCHYKVHSRHGQNSTKEPTGKARGA